MGKEAPRAMLVEYLLRLGDSALILAQRLSEWVAHAATMEEDVALGNVALDLLGQGRELLTYAGEVEGLGRDEDAIAYFRDAPDYHNLLLVEQPNGDFGRTIVRQLLYDAYAVELWQGLLTSADERLAAIAGKAIKETRYHLQHSGDWAIRLGDGTDESAGRIREALEDLWMYTGELFLVDAVDEAMAEAGVAPLASELEPAWRRRVQAVLQEATLPMPKDVWAQRGGKQGEHTEHLGYVLAEMQHLQRTYPGAKW